MKQTKLYLLALLAIFSVSGAKAQANIGPVTSPQINGTFYVGTQPYLTIQSAVTAACATGVTARVVVPAAIAPLDTIAAATSCATVSLVDERATPSQNYTTVSGSFSLAASGATPAGANNAIQTNINGALGSTPATLDPTTGAITTVESDGYRQNPTTTAHSRDQVLQITATPQDAPGCANAGGGLLDDAGCFNYEINYLASQATNAVKRLVVPWTPAGYYLGSTNYLINLPRDGGDYHGSAAFTTQAFAGLTFTAGKLTSCSYSGGSGYAPNAHLPLQITDSTYAGSGANAHLTTDSTGTPNGCVVTTGGMNYPATGVQAAVQTVAGDGATGTMTLTSGTLATPVITAGGSGYGTTVAAGIPGLTGCTAPTLTVAVTGTAVTGLTAGSSPTGCSYTAPGGSAVTSGTVPVYFGASCPVYLAAPGTITATVATTGGTLAAGTYYYKVTALNSAGQTVGSPEVSSVTTGTTSSVALSWAAVTSATSYNIYRGTTAGGESVYYTSTTNSYTDTNAASTAGTVPISNNAITGSAQCTNLGPEAPKQLNLAVALRSGVEIVGVGNPTVNVDYLNTNVNLATDLVAFGDPWGDQASESSVDNARPIQVSGITVNSNYDFWFSGPTSGISFDKVTFNGGVPLYTPANFTNNNNGIAYPQTIITNSQINTESGILCGGSWGTRNPYLSTLGSLGGAFWSRYNPVRTPPNEYGVCDGLNLSSDTINAGLVQGTNAALLDTFFEQYVWKAQNSPVTPFLNGGVLYNDGTTCPSTLPNASRALDQNFSYTSFNQGIHYYPYYTCYAGVDNLALNSLPRYSLQTNLPVVTLTLRNLTAAGQGRGFAFGYADVIDIANVESLGATSGFTDPYIGAGATKSNIMLTANQATGTTAPGVFGTAMNLMFGAGASLYAGDSFLAGVDTKTNILTGPGVTSFNTRTGSVTLAASDVNGVGAITNATSGQAGTVGTISGLIAAGTNITLTGSGTTASPYSIAGAGSGGLPAGQNGQGLESNGTAYSPSFTSPFFQTSGITLFGDSTIANPGAGPGYTYQQLWYQLENLFGAPYSDLAVNGSQAADVARLQVFPNINATVSRYPPSLINIGVNDANNCGNTTGCLANYTMALQAAVSDAAIPSVNKVWGQSCTTTSGVTTADNTIPGVPALSSTTNATVITCTTPYGGTLVDVAWRAIDSNLGVATLAIDGTNVDTLNAYGNSSVLIHTANGTNDTVFAKEYTVATAATHTEVFTVTSPTLSTNVFSVVYAATPLLKWAAQAPPTVYVTGVIKQSTDAISATTAAFDTAAKNVATTYINDGLPVRFVNYRAFVNSTSDMSGTPTNVHGLAVADAVTTAASTTVTSATANFGKVLPGCSGITLNNCTVIQINGAGTSGGWLDAYIVGWNSQTSVTINTPAITSGTALTAYIGQLGDVCPSSKNIPLHAGACGALHQTQAIASVAEPSGNIPAQMVSYQTPFFTVPFTVTAPAPTTLAGMDNFNAGNIYSTTALNPGWKLYDNGSAAYGATMMLDSVSGVRSMGLFSTDELSLCSGSAYPTAQSSYLCNFVIGKAGTANGFVKFSGWNLPAPTNSGNFPNLNLAQLNSGTALNPGISVFDNGSSSVGIADYNDTVAQTMAVYGTSSVYLCPNSTYPTANTSFNCKYKFSTNTAGFIAGAPITATQFATSGSLTSTSTGTGAGTSPTAVAITGTPQAVSIVFTAGTTPAVNSPMATASFSGGILAAAKYSCTANNSASADVKFYVTSNNTSMTLNAGSVAPTASTAYAWTCIGLQ